MRSRNWSSSWHRIVGHGSLAPHTQSTEDVRKPVQDKLERCSVLERLGLGSMFWIYSPVPLQQAQAGYLVGRVLGFVTQGV